MLNISDPKPLVNSRIQPYLRYRIVTLQFKVECKLVNSKQLKEVQVLQENLPRNGDGELDMVDL